MLLNDPFLFATACLFLACKVEDNPRFAAYLFPVFFLSTLSVLMGRYRTVPSISSLNSIEHILLFVRNQKLDVIFLRERVGLACSVR